MERFHQKKKIWVKDYRRKCQCPKCIEVEIYSNEGDLSTDDYDSRSK